ncbi:MAG TPA: hypothetical protein DCP92_11425 [Nitrospiraceae bacterium]|nr:hypothetical protein [Nitrospiraceae bacterium]
MKLLLIAIFLFFSTQGESASNTVHRYPMETAKELIDSGRAAEAIAALSAYRPASAELSLYHYTYAKALTLSKRVYDSLEHLRLAYIYCPSGEMKERSLLDRADAYLLLKNYYEASLCFRLFLKTFPDSPFSERAHYGLAESLYRVRSFSEALEQYGRAGDTPSALSGRANSLQSLGRVKEANDLYMILIGRDGEYVRSSYETQYYIGENFRLMGKFHDAKLYLNSIKEQTLKWKAALSLGLIAQEESQLESATRFFDVALQSPDREVHRSALLSLADTFIKMGRQKDAESKLLEIRNRYPYVKEYDSAIFMLAALYKKDGKFHEATDLLKELVCRRSPDRKALEEFEGMLIDAEQRDTKEFVHLWRSVGHSLMESSRSEFLLKVAEKLRNSGEAFTEECEWLRRNGSDEAKNRCSLLLAEYYADMGDAAASEKYLEGAQGEGTSDDLIRIKAKMYHLNAQDQNAADALISIKTVRQEDIVLLSGMLGSVKNVQGVLAFYEQTLNKVGGSSSVYIALADKLAEMGNKADALRYYREAVSFKQEAKGTEADDQAWAYYRISVLSQDKESVDALGKIQKESDVLSRIASARIKEWNISEKMGKAF